MTTTFIYNDANGDYLGTITFRGVDPRGKKIFAASKGFPDTRPLYGWTFLPAARRSCHCCGRRVCPRLYEAVRDAMARIGVSPVMIEAVTIEEDD